MVNLPYTLRWIPHYGGGESCKINRMSNLLTAPELIRSIRACALYDTQGALQLFMKYLQHISHADRVAWCAQYRGEFGREFWQHELMNNWKVMDMFDPDPQLYAVPIEQRIERFMDGARDNGVTRLVEDAFSNPGVNRVLWTGAYRQDGPDWHQKLLLEQDGIQDRVLAIANVDEQSESWFFLSRDANASPFSATDVRLIEEALNEFPRLNYYLMLERGLLIGCKPLAPREREVLNLVLRSTPIPRIASDLTLTESTVRTYVNEIYKKLGVRNRAELFRRWLDPISDSIDS